MNALSSHRIRRLAGYLFLSLGAVFLIVLIRRVGWDEVIGQLRLVGWGWVPYLCIHALKEALTTSAWQVSFPDGRRRKWWRLFCINWAGSTVNKIYNTGLVGGEITKVLLVRQEASAQKGIASVLIAKLAEAFAQILFILAGIILIIRRLELPASLETGLLLAFSLMAVSVLVFWILQRRGLLGSLLGFLERPPFPLHLIGKIRRRVDRLDENIRAYHLSQLRPFWGAISLNLVRLFLTLIQVQLILSMLGAPGGFWRCYAIAAFSALINVVFFFIPGRLGAQEGGKVIIARALGMSTAQGLTLGIVSRLAQLSWSVLGLGVLLLWLRVLGQDSRIEREEEAILR